MAYRPRLVLWTMLLSTCAAQVIAQKIEQENIPDAVTPALVAPEFYLVYDVDPAVNPFYLRGDFDGDHKPDYAIRIKSAKGGQSGIAIWLSSIRAFKILGAGRPFRFAGSTSGDFNDLNVWNVYDKKPVEGEAGSPPPPKLIGEAILLGKSESGSGLIYWTGKSFRWYQQGD